VIPFCDAKPGDTSYVYSLPDGEMIGEHGWVTNLEYFDDRDEAVELRRQVWRLIAQDIIELDDPYSSGPEDEEER